MFCNFRFLSGKKAMSEVPCRRCDGSATIACMACMIPLCKFCSDRHSIHRRYRKHLRGSLEELRKRLVSEKRFVDILVEEKEKRDEIKTRRFKDALEKLRTKVAREKALRNDKRRIRDLESTKQVSIALRTCSLSFSHTHTHIHTYTQHLSRQWKKIRR